MTTDSNINTDSIKWFFLDMKKRKIVQEGWDYEGYAIRSHTNKVIIYMKHRTGKASSYQLNLTDLQSKVRQRKIEGIIDV